MGTQTILDSINADSIRDDLPVFDVGDTLIARSIIGSEFLGRIEEQVEIGARAGIRPSISGRAWVTERRFLSLDPGEFNFMEDGVGSRFMFQGQIGAVKSSAKNCGVKPHCFCLPVAIVRILDFQGLGFAACIGVAQ